MTKTQTSTTIEHREETPTSLPSMHIDHSAVFVNEMDTRLMGFDSGIAAVAADMAGMQAQFEREQAEAAMEHERAMADRQRLKTDLERARRMTLAAKEAYGAEIPQQEQAPAGGDANPLTDRG